MTWRMFSNHSALQPEIKNKKRAGKPLNTWKTIQDTSK